MALDMQAVPSVELRSHFCANWSKSIEQVEGMGEGKSSMKIYFR